MKFLNSNEEPSCAHTRAVILLGASNLTIGWNAMLKALRMVVTEPVDLRVALGMGRSYLSWSRFWFRRLPGIIESQLWHSLPSNPSSLTPLAMLTDIGNDLVYERSPDEIFKVVRECVDRLRCWHAATQLVMTGLPLKPIQSIGPLHYKIARTILFPGCRLSLQSVMTNAARLDELCRVYANAEGIDFVEPAANWYGVDPIHVLPRYRVAAFQHYFSSWNLPKEPSGSLSDTTNPFNCNLPTTHERTVIGIRRFTKQPVFRESGLIVSAY